MDKNIFFKVNSPASSPDQGHSFSFFLFISRSLVNNVDMLHYQA